MCAKYSELIFNYIKPPTLLELGSSKDKTVKVRDCLDIKPLIVGGQRAKPKEFPHMVIINMKYNVLVICNTYIFYITGFVGL